MSSNLPAPAGFPEPIDPKTLEALRSWLSSPGMDALIESSARASRQAALLGSSAAASAMAQSLLSSSAVSAAAAASVLPSLRTFQAQLAQPAWASLVESITASQSQLLSDFAVALAKQGASTQSFAAWAALSTTAEIHTNPPDEAGFRRLADLVTTGEIDGEELAAADAAVVDDVALNAAVDAAVDELTNKWAWLNRDLARRVVVALIFLTSLAAIAVVTITFPEAAIVMSAAGVTAKDAAEAGGKAFDHVRPPTAEDDDAD